MSKRTPTHKNGKTHDLGYLECRSRTLSASEAREGRSVVTHISFTCGEYTFTLTANEAKELAEYAAKPVTPWKI